MDKRLPSQEEIWFKHYETGAKEENNDIEVDKTLWEVIEEKIFEYEGIPAIDYYGRKIKRLEFRDMVYNWAKTFKAMGIEKGEIVPVFSTFTTSVAAMALALNAIGACPNFAKIGLTAEKYNKELIDGKFAIILSPLYNEEMNEFLGQERFKNIIASYYRGAHGILLIYDVTDKDSFKNLSNWLIEIEKNASKNVLKVLIGNKADLEDKRVITYNQGKDFADAYGLKFIETSAKKNMNVNEAFETLGRELMKASSDKKINNQKENKTISVSKAQDLNTPQKEGCC
jgi:acyl-coenzyme A synthetase/AMP-(fatty) acid ligase